MIINLNKKLAYLLVKQQHKICTVESCTAGLLSTQLTEVSGSSQFFTGGLVTYSNQSKSQLLKIDIQEIIQFNPISPQISLKMAQKGLKIFQDIDPQTTICISITGHADNLNQKTNNGECYITINTNKLHKTFYKLYHEGRTNNRQQIVKDAINYCIEMLSQE